MNPMYNAGHTLIIGIGPIIIVNWIPNSGAD